MAGNGNLAKEVRHQFLAAPNRSAIRVGGKDGAPGRKDPVSSHVGSFVGGELPLTLGRSVLCVAGVRGRTACMSSFLLPELSEQLRPSHSEAAIMADIRMAEL